MSKEEIKKRLIDILGPRNVSDSEVVRESYKYMPFSGLMWRVANDFVTLPETVEQVVQIVQLANEFKIPISPRGSLGFGGFKGGILIDTTQLNKILKIDVENAKAIAEGGCSYFKLAYELFKKGFIIPISEFGPGVTTAATAQNPAVCFGGTRYGRNNEVVEGLEVVLPTGEVLRVGSLAYDHTEFGAYSRYITGPDLVGLFTQHGGANGIITKVAYRCARKPKAISFHTYYWPRAEITELTKAIRELTLREIFHIQLNDRPETLSIEESGLMPKLPEDCWFMTSLMVTAETDKELEAKTEWVDEICKGFGGKYLEYNLSQEHWDYPSFFHMTAHPVMQEIYNKSDQGFLYIVDSLIYPLSKFPVVYKALEEMAKKYGLFNEKILVLDAFVLKDLVVCSQLWIFYDPYDKELRKKCAKFHFESSDLFGEMGATWQNMYPPVVSEWAWKNQESAHKMVVEIKKLIDPNNILMPGNIF
jgi:glycolate dehydrogenase FAD-linked subunit